MIKFWIANRPKPGQTLEQFDYEWGVVHTALMLTNRTSLEAFERYTQHRTIADVKDAEMLIPRSPQQWCAVSDHWLDSLDAFDLAFSPEYKRRLQPHSFGDSAFVLELTSGTVVHDENPQHTRTGGVKLLHFLHKRDEISQEEFVGAWQDRYSEALLDAAARTRPLIRRYVQNPQLPLDPSQFEGTLFEQGGCQTYAGIEEFWFDSLEDLKAFSADNDVRKVRRDASETFLDFDRSFGLPVVERVAFDRTIDGASQPAIFDPDSFESRLVNTESAWGKWREPQGARIPADDRAISTR